MFAQKPILRLIDAGGQERRPALVGMNALEQTPMSRADIVRGGTGRKAKDLIGLLVSHGARIRRSARPRVAILLSVVSPTGESAVEISLD